MGICKFCGDEATLTLEHPWGDWAEKYIREVNPGDSTIVSRREGEIYANYGGPEPEMTLKILCKTCNNERLGRHDDLAAPILKPLIVASPRAISRADQAIISSWAVKSAMVFEFTRHPDREPFFTADERKRFALDATMPTNIAVFAARFAFEFEQLTSHAEEVWLTPEGFEEPLLVLISTVSIGQFAVQVWADRGPAGNSFDLTKPSPSIKQMSPTRGWVVWPPNWALDRERMNRYMEGRLAIPNLRMRPDDERRRRIPPRSEVFPEEYRGRGA